jgi:hypothetical protein
MNSRVEPEVIWGSVVGDREQDRPGRVVGGQVDPPVVEAGVDGLEQSLGFEGGSEREFDLGRGLLDRDDLGEPLPGDQVLDDEHRHPGPSEVRRVVNPDRVRGVLDPVRERPSLRLSRPRKRPKVHVCKEKRPPHRRW